VPDSATGQDARPALVGQIAREAFGSGRPLRAVLAALAGRHPASLGLQLRAVLRVLGDISLDEVGVTTPDAAMADETTAGPSTPLAFVPTPPSLAGPVFSDAVPVSDTLLRTGGSTGRPSSRRADARTPPSSASGIEAADELQAAEVGWTRVPAQAWSVRPMGVRVGE
jgi:hypothetical protein